MVDVKGIREALGISQQELADFLGVTVMTIWRWEKNRAVPSPHTAAILVAMKAASAVRPGVGKEAVERLRHTGIVSALRFILSLTQEVTESTRDRE